MTTNFVQKNLELSALSPREILKYAFAHYDTVGISFSGAEDIVVVDMAIKLNKNVTVFTLDTGRLHAETYRYLEKIRKHYGIALQVFSPDAHALQNFIADKGLYSFYEDGHKECCGIRKIEPLKRALSQFDAWVTGQRKDQSPGTRNHIPVIEPDGVFTGKTDTLIKFNPLANWSSEEVWNYIRMMEIPYNTLHEQGYKSIGCEPCTRPTLPNQHEREGRWWWEEATQKECGLHAANTTSNTAIP